MLGLLQTCAGCYAALFGRLLCLVVWLVISYLFTLLTDQMYDELVGWMTVGALIAWWWLACLVVICLFVVVIGLC